MYFPTDGKQADLYPCAFDGLTIIQTTSFGRGSRPPVSPSIRSVSPAQISAVSNGKYMTWAVRGNNGMRGHRTSTMVGVVWSFYNTAYILTGGVNSVDAIIFLAPISAFDQVLAEV